MLRLTSNKLAASYQSRDTRSTGTRFQRKTGPYSVSIFREFQNRESGVSPSRMPNVASKPPRLKIVLRTSERYLPTNIRIPASSASALINLLGITKRTNDGRPLRISQTANSIIPTDISAPPLLYEFPSSFPPNPRRSKDRRETPRLRESILCDSP
jgi:hypothetical protein